jgi:endo-1,4-beta-D-glucanase Y
MARIVDLFLVYNFVSRLITPYDQWDAYKLGIIDDKGKVLRKRNTLTTDEEKKAWGYFDILANNVKKIIQAVKVS